MDIAAIQRKSPIGQLLQQSGLISENQLELALQNQAIPGYENLKLEEILALRGWVKQETLDFFAIRWPQIVAAVNDNTNQAKLGLYLTEANLLTKEQLTDIIQQQKTTRLPFNQLVIEKGYLKQQTLDFFIQHLSANNAVFAPISKEAKAQRRIGRGEKYFKLGDTQGAILELREAIKLDPNNAQAYGWLTLIYMDFGETSLAKIYLKKAMELAANDAFVKEVQKKFFDSVPSSSQQTAPKAQKQAHRSWLKIG
jgi:tetratricopeptide (TPR) repeat protein